MVTTNGQNPNPSSFADVEQQVRKPSPANDHIAVAIYAKGGVGKTTLASTMPGKGIVLDVPVVEGGTSVLTPYADRIDVLPVTSWDKLERILQWLTENPREYKWVAVDTITAMQSLAKRKTLRERELSADPNQITQQDWGKIANLNGELYHRLRLLPMHSILLAQEVRKGRDDEPAMYQPDVSPASLSLLIPPMFLVGRLFMSEVDDGSGGSKWERQLRVGPHANYVTKARALPDRQPPPVIREPNLGQILNYCLGGKAKAPERATELALALTFE